MSLMIKRMQLKLSFAFSCFHDSAKRLQLVASSAQSYKELLVIFQVTNASRAPLPEGPAGYNGTQGPPGPSGPPGSGNLTLCSYGRVQSAGQAPDLYATEIAERTEPNVRLKVDIIKSNLFPMKR